MFLCHEVSFLAALSVGPFLLQCWCRFLHVQQWSCSLTALLCRSPRSCLPTTHCTMTGSGLAHSWHISPQTLVKLLLSRLAQCFSTLLTAMPCHWAQSHLQDLSQEQLASPLGHICPKLSLRNGPSLQLHLCIFCSPTRLSSILQTFPNSHLFHGLALLPQVPP